MRELVNAGAETPGGGFERLQLGMAKDDARQTGVGGHFAGAAELELLVGEGLVVVAAGKVDGGVVREERLDNDFSDVVGTAAAACDLGEQLKSAFGAAEIGQGKGGVGTEDTDQGDVGEVQAFADHLRAEQDIEAACGEIGEDRFVVVAAHGIAIHTLQAGAGDLADEFVFGFLCSGPDTQELSRTQRAQFGKLGAVLAIVAHDVATGLIGFILAAMEGKADRAVGAVKDEFAG